MIQLSYDASQIVIVIVNGNKKRSHAKTIRLDSGRCHCLGPTQRPEEQGQSLREEKLDKKIVFYLNQTQRPEEQGQLMRGWEKTFECRKLYFLSKSDTEGKKTSTTHKESSVVEKGKV